MNAPNNAIFLSYASQDTDAARRICEALRAAGLEVWFDQSELRGGDAWDQSIKKEIKECSLFLPIISANTNARIEGYFRLEWKLAVDRSHLMADDAPFFVPIILGDAAEPAARVPDAFRTRQWSRLNDDATIAAFAVRVAKLVGGSASFDGDTRTGAGISAPNAAPVGDFDNFISAPHPHPSPPPGSSPGQTLEGKRVSVTPAEATSPFKAASARGKGYASRSSLESTPARYKVVIAVVTAIVLIATAIFIYTRQNLGGAGQIASVAVLPFENSTGDSSIDYLSDGIAEGLINKLSSLSGVRVISRNSSFSFKGKKMDAIAIGQKLGVDAIILGSLAQRGTNLAIRAELVRISNQSQMWGEKYDRQADDVLKIEAEMATTIAATITKTLSRTLSDDEKTKLTRASTDSPEAYRLYLKGHDFRVGSQREMDKSIDYFQQAIAVAPNYALAHAGLAQAYVQQAFLRAAGRAETAEKARAAVNRALALDPNLAEAHNALGIIRFYLDWDWSGAEIEFQRALDLNATSATIRADYGNFLTVTGRLDAGLAQLEAAVKLDPHAVRPLHDLGINAWGHNDLDLAATRFRRALEIEPNWAWGYIKLSRVLAQQKKCAESLVQAQKGEAIIADGAAPLARAWLGAAYGICGDVTRARQKLAELQTLEKKQYVDPVTFAEIHVALGELDQALDYYEKALADRTPNMAYAWITKIITPSLAASPRYKALVDRLAFPKS